MVAIARSLRKDGRRFRAEDGVFGWTGGRGFEQGLREFEADGGAAKLFEGVGAAGLVGVEDGEGVRELGGRGGGDR